MRENERILFFGSLFWIRGDSFRALCLPKGTKTRGVRSLCRNHHTRHGPKKQNSPTFSLLESLPLREPSVREKKRKTHSVGQEVDDFEGVSNNADSHELLSVVSSVSHERVGEALNNGALEK